MLHLVIDLKTQCAVLFKMYRPIYLFDYSHRLSQENPPQSHLVKASRLSATFWYFYVIHTFKMIAGF